MRGFFYPINLIYCLFHQVFCLIWSFYKQYKKVSYILYFNLLWFFQKVSSSLIPLKSVRGYRFEESVVSRSFRFGLCIRLPKAAFTFALCCFNILGTAFLSDEGADKGFWAWHIFPCSAFFYCLSRDAWAACTESCGNKSVNSSTSCTHRQSVDWWKESALV